MLFQQNIWKIQQEIAMNWGDKENQIALYKCSAAAFWKKLFEEIRGVDYPPKI